jgi:BlaI family penicillinase repressor
MKTPRPSHLELQVLSVLWTAGEATVHEVLAGMPDGKRRAYTTVLSVLQHLESKGLVRKTASGKQNLYFATKTRGVMVGSVIRDLVVRVFNGRAVEFVQQILSEVSLTPGEARAAAGMLLRPRGRAVSFAAGNKPTNPYSKTMAVKKKAAKKAAPAKKAAAKKAAPAKKAAAKKAPAKKAAAKKAPAKKAAVKKAAKKAAKKA